MSTRTVRDPGSSPVANPVAPSDGERIAPPCADASLSSGPSPTAHLIGLGSVGCALLRLPALPARIVAASDRSASVYDAAGLAGEELARFKAAHGRLSPHPRAAVLPLAIALSVADAQLVVDATDSNLAPAARAAAVARTRAILRAGRTLVFAAKTPLLLEPGELRAHREQLRAGALFGGTGRAWHEELAQREAAGAPPNALAAVPNATTSEVIDALERGGTLAGGLDRARAAGLVEADAEQDLDGRDAALKLALAARLAFGIALEPGAIERPHAGALDPGLLRRRRARGRTTRLVARLSPAGEPSLAYEELPRGHPLAVPCRRVAWGFEARDGTLRLHLGRGLGATGTALALRDELAAAAAAEARR